MVKSLIDLSLVHHKCLYRSYNILEIYVFHGASDLHIAAHNLFSASGNTKLRGL